MTKRVSEIETRLRMLHEEPWCNLGARQVFDKHIEDDLRYLLRVARAAENAVDMLDTAHEFAGRPNRNGGLAESMDDVAVSLRHALQGAPKEEVG